MPFYKHKRVRVCYHPRTEDSFGKHVRKIQFDLLKELNKRRPDRFNLVEACKHSSQEPHPNKLVVVIQPQGRLGDEIASILTESFLGAVSIAIFPVAKNYLQGDEHRPESSKGNLSVLVAVINDDETSVTDSSALDSIRSRQGADFETVDLHVVPGQEQLHECRGDQNRNKMAIEKIRKWVD